MSPPRTNGELSPPRALLRSEESDGCVAVIESTMPAECARSAAAHHAFDETFYVLEGELTFKLGDELSLCPSRRGRVRARWHATHVHQPK
jgi:hypothetical protein